MSRGRIILGPVWLALTALLVVAWLCFREPRAGGEPLSYWLRLGAEPDRLDEAATPSPESEAAIRSIGAKAIPTLLAKLQTTDPSWKEKTYHWLNKQGIYSFEFTPDYYERTAAIYGFTILGSNALSALPELERIFWNTNTSWEAAQALAQLGRASLPALRAGFTNSDTGIRRAAVISIMNNTNLTLATLPDMRSLRHDSDRLVATAALRQLMFHSTREEATRLAIEILEDNRARWRGTVLSLFNQVSIHTNQVVPVLVRLLEDPDPRLRRVITNTLKQLDPVTAAAAGVDTNPPPVRGGRGRRAPTGTNTPLAPQQ